MCYFIAQKQNIAESITIGYYWYDHFCNSKFHWHEYNYWGEKTKSNSNLFRYILLGFFNRSSALLRSIFFFYAIILYAFSGGKPLLSNNINDKLDVTKNIDSELSFNNIWIDSIYISTIKLNRLFAFQIHVRFVFVDIPTQ